MKIAIVHDWIASYTGAEKCLESFLNIWPEADLFLLVNLYETDERFKVFNQRNPKTSFLQRNKLLRNNYRKLLFLFPYAVESFDLSGYDLVVSSSWAVAKGALTNSSQLHVCYCHTPIRYAWDLTFQYLRETGLTKGLKGLITKLTLHYIRLWDVSSSNRVDYFAANSRNISRRIKKIYGRESEVIYPPVDTSFFTTGTSKEDYYITVSRFVPYKKIDIIVQAFAQMPDKKLIIIGDGPDKEKLSTDLSQNITIINFQPREKLKSYLQRAKAFVFAAEEDFGISIVESLACGTPVIAFNKGGASETVEHGKTGIFFEKQDKDSIVKAVSLFESGKYVFDPETLNDQAQKYSKEIFEEKIKQFVEDKLKR